MPSAIYIMSTQKRAISNVFGHVSSYCGNAVVVHTRLLHRIFRGYSPPHTISVISAAQTSELLVVKRSVGRSGSVADGRPASAPNGSSTGVRLWYRGRQSRTNRVSRHIVLSFARLAVRRPVRIQFVIINSRVRCIARILYSTLKQCVRACRVQCARPPSVVKLQRLRSRTVLVCVQTVCLLSSICVYIYIYI